MVVKRGEIYWCDLDPAFGHEQRATRPAVIVSADSYNQTASRIVAITPLTSADPKAPIHFRVPKESTGLETDSTVLVDHTRFVDKRRLKGLSIGRLQPSALALLDRNLSRVLDLQ
jgi:mRNA interferase MazF